MKQFEVWETVFDPSVGAEIRKTRPALIVSNNTLNDNLKTIIVVPLTSRRRYEIPSRVQTNFREKGGDIALDQIKCIDKSRLIKKLGVIDEDEKSDILEVLHLIFIPE